MKQIKLTVEKREETGSGAVGRLRKAGIVPGVVYGKSGAVNVQIKESAFRMALREIKGSAALIELAGAYDKPILSIIQDTQRHALKDYFMHVDFQELSEDKEIVTSLPIHYMGESNGVKNQNGMLNTHHTSVEVKCLPKNLPSNIEVDLTELSVNEAITIGDLKSIDGVVYTAEKGIALVSCAEGKRIGKAAEEESKEEESR